MADVVKALYSCSYGVWNTLMQVAFLLFSTTPEEAAGGAAYETVHTLYTAISDATVPVTTVFFIIALYKTVVQSAPEQQARKFLLDGLRYVMILVVGANAWEVMGYVISFADGITQKLGGMSDCTLSVSADIEATIDECLVLPEFSLSGEWFSSLWTVMGCGFIFLLGGTVLLLVITAGSLSIISSAFNRILKPLLILPFAGIAVALGAGGHEISRSFMQYVKTLFGFAISGALMIICIKTGYVLCTTFVSFDMTSFTPVAKCIMATVQTAVTPLVIAGMVKSVDSVTARMF